MDAASSIFEAASTVIFAVPINTSKRLAILTIAPTPVLPPLISLGTALCKIRTSSHLPLYFALFVSDAAIRSATKRLFREVKSHPGNWVHSNDLC
jgi:hypothetical protein